MKTIALLEDLKFSNQRGISEALLADERNRILRFCLHPHQEIVEHSSPHSSVVLLVLKGNGLFSGADGEPVKLEEQSMAVFEPGEKHRIQAQDQELVFLAFLQGTEQAHPAVGLMAE